MHRYILLSLTSSLLFLTCMAQDKDYLRSIESYQKKYVKEHEVVTGADKKFLQFFPISENYRVTARFERIYEAPWFRMPTSGTEFQTHRVYGILYFTLNDTSLKLTMYQSEDLMKLKDYADYLFVPFTDKTCGYESYDNGRYIDLKFEDIKDDTVILDFNKAYNPYCAYIMGTYSCPVPPKENDLGIAVRSGEMKYGKDH